MLEVENLSPFTRGFTVNSKEFIFSAHQVRSDIPDYFLNSNGTIKFPGLLKLKRILSDDGEFRRAYIKKNKDYKNPNQEWEYIFVNEKGDKFITTKIGEFCLEHGLNVTSIRTYIKMNKPYMGWNITRRKIVDDEAKEDLENN
jgi:hypothetical protein